MLDFLLIFETSYLCVGIKGQICRQSTCLAPLETRNVLIIVMSFCLFLFVRSTLCCNDNKVIPRHSACCKWWPFGNLRTRSHIQIIKRRIQVSARLLTCIYRSRGSLSNGGLTGAHRARSCRKITIRDLPPSLFAPTQNSTRMRKHIHSHRL